MILVTLFKEYFMIQKYSSGNIPKADNLNENDLSLIEFPKKFMILIMLK